MEKKKQQLREKQQNYFRNNVSGGYKKKCFAKKANCLIKFRKKMPLQKHDGAANKMHQDKIYEGLVKVTDLALSSEYTCLQLRPYYIIFLL